jgi:hypothetical protein
VEGYILILVYTEADEKIVGLQKRRGLHSDPGLQLERGEGSLILLSLCIPVSVIRADVC